MNELFEFLEPTLSFDGVTFAFVCGGLLLIFWVHKQIWKITHKYSQIEARSKRLDDRVQLMHADISYIKGQLDILYNHIAQPDGTE